MRYFIQRVLIFLGIPAALIAIVAAAVPPTPRASQSLLFSWIDKQELLQETPPRRLILVGGSNLSFGIDSQMLADSTGLHPINTAIQATLGLQYMMDTILPTIQPGDVVVISAEYSQFYADYLYGGEELLRMVLDVDRSTLPLLSLRQWLNIVEYLPEYAISKIRPTEYFVKENPEIGIYERQSFNQYGDAVVHWAHKHSDFPPFPPISGKLNDEAFETILQFQQEITARGGECYLTYPGLQERTFLNMEDQIKQVDQVLREYGFQILGTPERYRMDELLMYNTPYHLNREGVVYRTQLLIEDLISSGAVSGSR